MIQTEAAAPVRLPTPAAAGRAMTWQVWAALGLVYVVWGSTYLAIRITVRELPPLYSASARFLVAGLLMLAIALARREWRTVSWRGIGLAAVPGVLLVAGGNGSVMIAEQTLQSSLAALIVALSPLLMAVMTMVLDRRLVSLRAGVGLLLGFAGLVLLVRPQPGGHVPLGAALIMLLAATLWAAGSVFAGRRGTAGMSASATSGFQMLAGAIALAIVALGAREQVPTALSPAAVPSLEALVYLVVVGALVGYTAYSWLLSRAPISIVSTYAYVNPVVAIALGVVLLQEHLGLIEIIASAVILSGVALIVSAPRPRVRAKAAAKAA